MEFKSILNNYQEKINLGISQLLPNKNVQPPRIHEAMLYSMQAGGKRLRSILLLAAHDIFTSLNDALPAAVAIECVHTYSLIHDDLPCIDNSSLRRGKPTNHIQFNEATALLAGDALLTYAFYLLSKYYRQIPQIACEMIYELSEAAGSTKLIGGQIEDLNHENTDNAPEKLDYIHKNKTAALISAALVMGLQLANADENKLEIARELGFHLGLAFQITDDILDLTATVNSLGKMPGLDQKNETLTYPKLYGLQESSNKVEEHTKKAIKLGQKLGGNNKFLLTFITSLEHRIQ